MLMNRFTTSVVVLVAAGLTAGPAAAALFSSTSTSGMHFGALHTSTSAFVSVPGQPGNLFQRFAGYQSPVQPIANSISVSVDTVADTGKVDDLKFGPTSIPANTVGGSYPVDVQILVTPANFPDPPVYQDIQGTYTETFSINSVTILAPDFTSSTTAPIVFKDFPTPHFVMIPTLTIAQPAFTVTGDYAVSGPTESRIVPFSVQFTPSFSQQPRPHIHLQGNPGFGDGFAFAPYGVNVFYQSTNGQVFNGTVDGVKISASLDGVFLRYFAPEPSGMGLAAMAAGVCAACQRRGRRRERR